MRPGVTPCVPQDNRSLKEQNDELNGQIINLSIQGARSLFSTAFSESLAAEISSVSRDEVTAPPPHGPAPQVPHAARPPRGLQASAVQAPGTNPAPPLPPQLMDAIQKQEEINFRLQDYIDRIIVAIMETNPSILEVK